MSVSLTGEKEVLPLQSHTHSHNLHTTSRYFFFPTLPVTAEKCPQKEYSSVPDLLLWLSGGLSHIPTNHLVLESKTRLLFKNSKSDLRSAWELCVFCLLECDELACSHPVLASFLLHGFFSTVQPDPRMDRGEAGAQESVWHNHNNWGSVCEASRRKRERENWRAVLVCITGRDDYSLVTYTHCSLWATLLSGIGSGHAFAFVYPWVGWKRRNLTFDLSVAT